jgi:hypothetical protein
MLFGVITCVGCVLTTCRLRYTPYAHNYTKQHLCRASCIWANNARNMYRHWLLIKKQRKVNQVGVDSSVYHNARSKKFTFTLCKSCSRIQRTGMFIPRLLNCSEQTWYSVCNITGNIWKCRGRDRVNKLQPTSTLHIPAWFVRDNITCAFVSISDVLEKAVLMENSSELHVIPVHFSSLKLPQCKE